jgi:ubiquinone/menaquinone biosynthesis C-methylase UbiE
VRAWSQSLPFGGCFDTVVATFPTEYIADPGTLAEIWRVLHPEGKLVVLPGAWIGGKSILESLARWLFKVTGQGEEIRASLWDRFKIPFERAGFRVEVRVEETRGGTLLILLAKKG